ncbi:hypothetical protein [Acidovorax sp. A1169]|uniref:hypothetical protein n=1 Tax=Acidovorax sp. A1169 TaxID=3059524 RepID=UPI0027380273|nr:hypothetical protein [Acidovorax sp. A1169]MDP4076250.1 hypothetical protein [Acidovorax sp. A1169]
MNDSTTPAPVAIPDFGIPPGARAVLVTDAGSGNFNLKPVPHRASVVDIERDLTEHLDNMPYSDEWLMNLRAYVDRRLQARAEARGTGGVAMARGDGWNILHTQIRSAA